MSMVFSSVLVAATTIRAIRSAVITIRMIHTLGLETRMTSCSSAGDVIRWAFLLPVVFCSTKSRFLSR